MSNSQTEQENFMNDLKALADKVLFLSSELPFALGVLDRLLDTATMLAVCKEEYPDYNDVLQKYDFIYNYLEKTEEAFEEYGAKLFLPDILADKIHK